MMDFYDAIAGHYDAVVRDADRREGVQSAVDRLIDEYEIRSAVDAACGTGAFAQALARRGVEIVGLDRSAAMLDRARQAAAEEGLDVRCVLGDLADLPALVPGPHDAIFCMGNSLPHLQTDEELVRVLSGFAAALRPGGLAAVSLLNYEKILRAGERVVGAGRDGAVEAVRFYDFLDERSLRFNILRIDWSADTPATSMLSTTLRPWRVAELVVAFEQAGFGKIELREGSVGKVFDPACSDVLVLCAVRG